MSWDHVINAASSAWKIIQDGKPSMEVSTNNANAVPDVNDWQNLTDAHGPTWVGRHLKWTNYLGIDVVDVHFKVFWEYGARYNGGGAFIPNCHITVLSCDVAWGFDFDLNMRVHNPTNAGTATAPRARLPISISGSVSSPLTSRTLGWEYVLFGDGTHEAH